MNLQKIILKSRFGLGVLMCHATWVQAADMTLIDAKPAAASVLAAPLLSYQEQAASTELQRLTDWMTMPASKYTTDQILAEGKALSNLPNKPIDVTRFQPGLNKAYDLSGRAMQKGLPVEKSPRSDALPTKANFYQSFADYFTSDSGNNPTKLGGLNIANILQADLITDSAIPRDIINLLVDPFPEKISSIPNQNSTVVEKENFAQKMASQGLLSVPMNALSEMVARRVPSPGASPKSMMQVLRNESETRIKDNQWSTSLIGLSQEALLREIAYMQAVQLQMQYQQYRLNEQAVSLLAVIASGQAKFGPMLADLAKQLNQAKTLR